MTDELPPPRLRTSCPLCDNNYASRTTLCTINRAAGIGGSGWCNTAGSWGTAGARDGMDYTFVDDDQRIIDKAKGMLSYPTEAWSERDWVLRDAVAALERMRAALTDVVLDMWVDVPPPGDPSRHGPEFFEAMGASSAAGFAGMPPSVWASPEREPLVELRRIARLGERP